MIYATCPLVDVTRLEIASAAKRGPADGELAQAGNHSPLSSMGFFLRAAFFFVFFLGGGCTFGSLSFPVAASSV